MTQSTTPHSNDRAVLLQRGGELSEFVDLLSELAIPVDECNADFPDPEQLESARLVVVPGKRLLETNTPNLNLWPRTIAILDDSSRTLVTHLSRIGVAMVIQRPIHPRTLRLLLLHEIYHGPERRGRKRILIGHPVRIGSGLFRPRATLLELSPTGARIELANAPKVGTRIRILIGKDLTKNRPLKLHAKVIRSIGASSKNDRTVSEIGVALLDANDHAKAIKGILDRFAMGPARWKTKQPHGRTGSHPSSSSSNSRPETTGSRTSCSLPPTHTSFFPSKAEAIIDDAPFSDATTREIITSASEIEIEIEADTAEPEFFDEPEVHSDELSGEEILDTPRKSSNDPLERRRDIRVPYDQRVVALGEEAARVLVGRDLCGGGMRIAQTPSVAIGDALRVALHSGTQSEPLIVLATASRDDGDDGIVLSFGDLPETQRAQLEKIISAGLPVHANGNDLDDPLTMDKGIVVAEMLETVSRESDSEIDEIDEIEAHLNSVFDTSESIENAR